MNLTSAEKQRLWQLFQACDTDSDGLLNNDDIRLLSRSELSEYTPEEIIDLFSKLNKDGSSFTFDEFINKKLIHDHLSQMSETTSISSDFTNASTDESLLEHGYRSKRFYTHNNYPYDNMNKNNLFSPEIDCTLSKSMNNLQLDSDPNYQTLNLNSNRRIIMPPLKHANTNKYDAYKVGKMADLKRFKSNLLPEEIERFDLSDDVKKKFELIRQVNELKK